MFVPRFDNCNVLQRRCFFFLRCRLHCCAARTSTKAAIAPQEDRWAAAEHYHTEIDAQQLDMAAEHQLWQDFGKTPSCLALRPRVSIHVWLCFLHFCVYALMCLSVNAHVRVCVCVCVCVYAHAYLYLRE